ncbi:SRPBCC family protein [Ideonella sp.]|uniref:SRPBCC family protein n=1 Tax=Ideonella sp. TaxID=1929293 RepID=UPI0035B1322F
MTAQAQPALPAGSRQRTYAYVTHWRLDAPPEAVWQALTEVDEWPQWWPYVRSVTLLRRGREPDGVGALRRIAWGSRLPYGFTLDVECVESDAPRRLLGRSSGALEGEGLWELWPDGAGTVVRYTWRLYLNTTWMRLAAPLMAPLFHWNHEGVMRGGGRGLVRWLAGERPARVA